MSASRQHPVYIAYLAARSKPLILFLDEFIQGNDLAFTDFIHHWDENYRTEAEKDEVNKYINRLLGKHKETKDISAREKTILGYAYENILDHKDSEYALQLYESVCHELPLAKTLCAISYGNKDREKSIRYLKEAQLEHIGLASYCLFEIALRDSRPKDSVHHLEIAASQSELLAISYLAESADGNIHGHSSKEYRLSLATQAANRGEPRALCLVAHIQYYGELRAAPRNNIKIQNALDFLILCAEERNTSNGFIATDTLGNIYRESLGVPRNLAKAAYYFRRSLELSPSTNPEAQVKRLAGIINLINEQKQPISALSDEHLAALFHASFALHDKQTFNKISSNPGFIALAKNENWETVAFLLKKENADRIYIIIKTERDEICDYLAVFPTDIIDIVRMFLGMHSSYLKTNFSPDPLFQQFNLAYRKRKRIILSRSYYDTLSNEKLLAWAQTSDLSTLEQIIEDNDRRLYPHERNALHIKAATLGSIIGLRCAVDIRGQPIDNDNLDHKKIRQYCERAFELGDWFAAVYLAQLFFEGRQVSRDLKQAKIYLSEAYKRRKQNYRSLPDEDLVKFIHNIFDGIESSLKILRENPNDREFFGYTIHAISLENKYSDVKLNTHKELRKLNRQLYWELVQEQSPSLSAAPASTLFATPCLSDSKADTDLGEKNNLRTYIACCLDYRDLEIPKRCNLESALEVLSKLDTRNKKLAVIQFEKIRKIVADALENTKLSSELRHYGINLGVPFVSKPLDDPRKAVASTRVCR